MRLWRQQQIFRNHGESNSAQVEQKGKRTRHKYFLPSTSGDNIK